MGVSLNPATLLSGQGIDVSSLVNQILAKSSGQLTEWDSEQSTLQSQASALNSINSDLNSLATAVTALSDPLGAITSQAATSSNSSVLTAIAQTTALPGNHSIVVTNLASAGTVYTNEFTEAPTDRFWRPAPPAARLICRSAAARERHMPSPLRPVANDTLTTLASYINKQKLGSQRQRGDRCQWLPAGAGQPKLPARRALWPSRATTPV